MANRVINTILNLRDNMSGGLIRAARNTAGVTREMESATRSVVAFKPRRLRAGQRHQELCQVGRRLRRRRNGGVSGHGQRHGGVPDRPGQTEYRL